MRLYLIRHGRQKNRLCNSNVELSPEGRRQAALVAGRLQRYGVQALYSSQLIRAVETAQIINEVLQVPYQAKAGLQEIYFGVLENRSDEENHRDYAAFFAEFDTLSQDIPYPGGECGADVYRRGMSALQEIIAEAEQQGYEQVAIVTHGVWIRSMIAGLIGRDFTVKSLVGKQLENVSITELLYIPEKKRFVLERLNDYAHLEEEPELLRSAWRS